MVVSVKNAEGEEREIAVKRARRNGAGLACYWFRDGVIFSRRSGSSGIKSNRCPGDVIPDDNDCGRYVPFSSVMKENIMTHLFTPLHLWWLYDYSE
ncbi:hypothetical protein OHF33_19780 [Escherichia coli]|uniref:hypothetical protein n=1 Tax=Escherichia coli TaxID=562 RepID=UPI0021E7CB53|nr:hypothetical protein [Escherichia coli]MCV3050289.1 hypothetical protein [Escherichia coli]MCV3065168.1 hypothetical protein [Escherichia coli]